MVLTTGHFSQRDHPCPTLRSFLTMIYCQNCTTRNALTRQFCWKCGWKLLVPSRTAKSESPMGFMDEHVLERISSMEHALSTINKRLDTLAEAVEQVAANSFIDHTMIETLTDSLESASVNLPGLLDGSSSRCGWSERMSCWLRTAQPKASIRWSRRTSTILRTTSSACCSRKRTSSPRNSAGRASVSGVCWTRNRITLKRRC